MKLKRLALTVSSLLLCGSLSASALANGYLADAHADMASCDSCHLDGNRLSDDNLSHENAQCQSCHGSLAEVAETTQRNNYNAHDSHFPGDTSCTTCHAGHQESLNYCDSCHSFEFDMPYQGTWERNEPTIAELKKDADERAKALAAPAAGQVDVLVIGSGGAGFSAAVAAFDAGAKVMLVEKEPVIGGNAKLAAGGMNAAVTKPQAAKGIKDSLESMKSDTMKGGRNLNDTALVDVLVNNSSSSIDWLTGLGADLNDVGRMGGASVNRSHRPTGGAGVGAHVIQVLYDNSVKRDIDLRLNTRAVEVLKDDKGAVKGLLVKGQYTGYYWVKADAVVIATGGFGRNNPRVAELDPKLKGFIATNHAGATGDGLDVAAEAGAEMVDLEYIQAHPTLSIKGGVMVTEAVRGNGAILINREGKRFVNELTTRDKAAAAILQQKGKTAFLVFDDSVRKSLKKIEKYIKLGVVPSASSLNELAKIIEVDGANLTASVQRYNQNVAAGKDQDFERQNLPTELNQGNFYAIEVGPGVHHTMGGIKIDPAAEALNAKGKAIPGLFAAGEATGGVHGANRLGGNAISDIVTFGRLAGENAAKYSSKR
ncbi:flavocytochrome c [Paraferrimonas sedimenticola]|uniref:Fumarate reductase n=1 Tax=Paraferrimonas sedimenticola TaxID=375674 RepID=A0AA37RUD4_9GAMM|nr:flavocytochrome c [Paraferrimonas sedimenticola]GLP95024.1 fumarate reductase flavoprotein subunit [Paraferrimonas sedimenticola]